MFKFRSTRFRFVDVELISNDDYVTFIQHSAFGKHKAHSCHNHSVSKTMVRVIYVPNLVMFPQPQIHIIIIIFSPSRWAAGKNVEHEQATASEFIVFELWSLTTIAEWYLFFNFINHHLCASYALISTICKCHKLFSGWKNGKDRIRTTPASRIVDILLFSRTNEMNITLMSISGMNFIRKYATFLFVIELLRNQISPREFIMLGKCCYFCFEDVFGYSLCGSI